MKRILISGASGFVGRHLCRALATHHEVWGLSRRQPGASENFPGVRWLIHDLTSLEWPATMPRQLDAIVHLAQADGYREFPARAVDVFKVNVFGTEKLLDLARCTGVQNFVHVSTGGIYGTASHPFKETHAYHPSGALRHYLTTKYSAELLVADFGALFTTVTLRPFFIYGAGQDSEKLIPRLIARVEQGEPISLHGERGVRINPVHVSDMIAAITCALDLRESLVSNIAGPDVWFLRDMALAMGRELGRTPVFEVSNMDTSKDCVADLTVMTLRLGAPKVRFAEAIGEVCRCTRRS